MTSISEELADMYASKKNSASESLTLSAMMKEFKQPIAYKPFIVLMVVSLLGMLTGGMTLVVYSVTILNDLGFSGNPYLPSLVVNGLRVALFISNLWVIGNTKRRPTMIWTSLLMTVSMALLGANLVYQKQILASYPGQAGWLEFAPLVWICIYCVGYTWGAGSMIWVLMGEMCPVKIRGLTSGVAVTMAYAAVTISTYATNVVMKTYGLGITFLGYGIICALNGLYAYIYLPETKNKTEKEKDYHYISRN